MKNNYLYQGAFAELDEDIQWTDFPLRNYDAQIGRWVQQDPYQQFASPYVGMGNDPVNLIDPSGGFSWPPSGFLHLKTVAAGCSGAIRKALQISGQNVSALSLLSKVSIAIKTASTAEGIINSNVNSIQVGRQIARANSESTCMGCESASARAKIQNYEASIALHSVPQLNPASLNAEEKTASLKREMMMEQMSVNELARFKGEDAILDRIHKGTVAEVEGSHSGSFPIIGNFLKAGNYSLKGESFSAEAGDAFKKGVIESAATYGVGKLFRLGLGMFAAKRGAEGGLNLFKFGSKEATSSAGWKSGDRFLKMFDQGSPKLNWKQNSGFLRREMGAGNPIFDSYRLPNGNLIPTGGFLNAERSLLQSRGWIYSPGKGAWLPSGF